VLSKTSSGDQAGRVSDAGRAFLWAPDGQAQEGARRREVHEARRAAGEDIEKADTSAVNVRI
jgi:hypothetical protein